MLEYKASYVVKIDDSKLADVALPEILFHGSRGESGALAGMAQLTPYSDGVFQLHGMNEVRCKKITSGMSEKFCASSVRFKSC